MYDGFDDKGFVCCHIGSHAHVRMIFKVGKLVHGGGVIYNVPRGRLSPVLVRSVFELVQTCGRPKDTNGRFSVVGKDSGCSLSARLGAAVVDPGAGGK